jgi:hypothetical protein
MPDQHAQTRILFRADIETELETLAYHHKVIIARLAVYNDSIGRLAAAPHYPTPSSVWVPCGFFDGFVPEGSM